MSDRTEAAAVCGCVLCSGNEGGTRKLCDVGERILAYGKARRQEGAMAVMGALSDGQTERLRRALRTTEQSESGEQKDPENNAANCGCYSVSGIGLVLCTEHAADLASAAALRKCTCADNEVQPGWNHSDECPRYIAPTEATCRRCDRAMPSGKTQACTARGGGLCVYETHVP